MGAVSGSSDDLSRVWLLMVEVGRSAGDGLPAECDGAAILCYAAGVSEKEAVDETVAVLRQAEMAPIAVESHGTVAERAAEGAPLADADLDLARRAVEENAVIVAQVVPFNDDDDDRDEDGGEGQGDGEGQDGGQDGAQDGGSRGPAGRSGGKGLRGRTGPRETGP